MLNILQEFWEVQEGEEGEEGEEGGEVRVEFSLPLVVLSLSAGLAPVLGLDGLVEGSPH